MSFADPVRLWVLVAPAAAMLLVALRHRRRVRQQRRLASPAVWQRLMGGAPATGLLRLLGWCVAACMVVLALARPQWGELPGEESVRTRDLVVAVDVSDSMLCPDLRPSRLARSLELIHRVLPGLEGNRVGVVVFAGDAYPLVPLTTDLHAVASFLDAVEPGMVALPGSNIERAVNASLKLLPAEGDGRVVVLFSDGENLQGDVATASEAMRDAGVGVLAVVAGTEDGGPIPQRGEDGSVHYKRDQNGQPVVTHARREVLDAMAESSGGDVIELTAGHAERGFLEAVESLRTREIEATRKVQRVERFPIFLMAAAAVLVLSFAFSPWRRRTLAAAMLVMAVTLPSAAQQGPAPLAPPAAPGQATVPEAGDPGPPPIPWWQRFIPGGSRRLARSGANAWHEGDLPSSLRDFGSAAVLEPDDPKRLFDVGTALAAAGQLETAVAVLGEAQKGGVAGAAFNAGTASLQQSQAEMAVQYLRQALLEDASDGDVKRNYELALKLLEEQEQEQEQEQDQEQQDEEQEQEQEQEQQENEGEPTPTPTPGGQPQPQPTPTPDPNNPLYAALERAEAEARENMISPTPQAVSVEKDW